MGTLVEVGNTSDFKESEMKEFKVNGKQILLARAGERFYAASGRCPHLGGRLVNGRLDGSVVTCPLHGSQFDLADGHVVRWLKGSGVISAVGKAVKGPQALDVYNVKIDGGRIFVEI